MLIPNLRIGKARGIGGSYAWIRYMKLFNKYPESPKPLLLPIVARSAFNNDFKYTLNSYQLDYYYEEQCAMKHIFGVKATIKFIN